jgi:hypothetical protein
VEKTDGTTLFVLQEEKTIGAVKHMVVFKVREANTNKGASRGVEEADVAK